MKRLSIVILSVILSMSLCLPVMALDLDLIEDEKKEEIKDDYKEDSEIEEKKYENGTKAISYQNCTFGYFNYSQAFYIPLTTIDNGKEYYCYANGYYLFSSIYKDLFVRGSEGLSPYGYIFSQLNDGVGSYLGSIKLNGTNSYSDVNGRVRMNIIEYIKPEPTPEPTPTPDEPTVSDNTVSDNDITVSWNSVSENLISIEEQIRRLRQDVQNLANNTFSVSISNINVSDNQVSRNVISTGLQDYDLGEQLQLIGLILAFGALLVYIIHKSIYKWGR